MSTRRTNRNQGAPVGAPDSAGAQAGPQPVPAAAADAPANPTPQGTAGPQADGGASEPDDEPNPVLARENDGNNAENSAEKRGEKIDLRNVRTEKFSGNVPRGAYDSGVRDWWDQFSDQVDDAQILAGQEWSEVAKKSVLSIFLTDTARRWLKTYRADNPAATFTDTGNALVAKFRPNLTDQEITARIYSEGKHASETYQEYANRLLRMADGLSGGITNIANAHHALGTFLRLAWPQRKDVVHSHIRGMQGSPTSLIHEAVQFLSELSQSDGRLEDYKRRKLSDGSRGSSSDAKTKAIDNYVKGNGPGKAHVAVVERKRKPTKMPRRGGIVCFICGEEGHTAKYHRQHLSQPPRDNNETSARGNAATTEEAGERSVVASDADSEEDSA
ncbi:hypothetical protein PHMEG_00018994 [Phytophthora megakarya]|uniref:Uncharacterized protein n=1 Tax=Phytophthora megakarya TaxID=4795 RepID=A0A225VSZ9_9STRA|nr:hypothetical protein PHMEG_00018994 [Phytophthora megakarya]